MDASSRIDDNVTLPFKIYITHFEKRTSAGGQFGWGGTLLKGYQQGPKISSVGSEIQRRVQRQKLV